MNIDVKPAPISVMISCMSKKKSMKHIYVHVPSFVSLNFCSMGVIIPINMRDGSIIAVGKGNKDWNNSAPHGAGRLMSRRKAKETFNLEEFKKSMADIYSTSVIEETIDEAPFVYKPMREIIDNIQNTVEIEKIIKPIYNFKAKN